MRSVTSPICPTDRMGSSRARHRVHFYRWLFLSSKCGTSGYQAIAAKQRRRVGPTFATLSRLLNGQVVRIDRCLGPNSYFRRRHAGLVEAAAEAECKNAGLRVVHKVLV